jgi:hypothetical protein
MPAAHSSKIRRAMAASSGSISRSTYWRRPSPATTAQFR